MFAYQQNLVFKSEHKELRLIVKNLPCGKKTRWDEAKVRTQFSKFGTLTDVRLKLNEKTGACKFAFVGFATAESCQMAIKAMDGTVEECKALSSDRTSITKQISLNNLKKRNRSKGKIDDDNEEEEEEDREKGGDVDELIEKQILDTGRLFLRNLPYSCSDKQLRVLFAPFGPLAELECVVDKSGKCKGFALCTFIFSEHAVAAWKALDGTVFMGRMLHIIAGEEKRVRTAEEGADADGVASACRSSFQRERHQKLKANDAKATTLTNRTTWNALFLGTDAVAETLADNYEKRHLLLVDGDQQNSAAVRMAMIWTPRGMGKRNGCLDDLATLRRCWYHQHGITALVEMTNARDAKCAFEALAYSKKQSSPGGRPLFLEWAPSDVFDEGHPLRAIRRYGYQTQTGGEMRSDGGDPNKQNEDGGDGTKKTDDDEPTPKESGEEKEPEHNKMLVRNVPFQVNLKELSQLFSAFGELKFI